MALTIFLIIVWVGIWIAFANPLYTYLTTKREAKEGYYDMNIHDFVTKEQLTKRLESQRKREIVIAIVVYTSPLWIYFFFLGIWYVLLGLGTIFFCIELLAKGSGIK